MSPSATEKREAFELRWSLAVKDVPTEGQQPAGELAEERVRLVALGDNVGGEHVQR